MTVVAAASFGNSLCLLKGRFHLCNPPVVRIEEEVVDGGHVMLLDRD